MSYNGWPTYETWAVFTWVTSDEGAYREWERIGRRNRHNATAAAASLREAFIEAAWITDVEGRQGWAQVDWPHLGSVCIEDAEG